jgi:hypothetical protein
VSKAVNLASLHQLPLAEKLLSRGKDVGAFGKMCPCLIDLTPEELPLLIVRQTQVNFGGPSIQYSNHCQGKISNVDSWFYAIAHSLHDMKEHPRVYCPNYSGGERERRV